MLTENHRVVAVALASPTLTPFSAFGQQLNYKAHGKHATIDGAKIIETDIPRANGIIHVIDEVILPAEKSLLELIKNQKRFSTLTRLLQETGLDLPLASSRTTYTIFAPINEAWEKEPYKTIIKNHGTTGAEDLYGVLARHADRRKARKRKPQALQQIKNDSRSSDLSHAG